MKIPKIIHQFWIGNKKMPIKWMNTWQEKNPLLEHIIWSEKEIENFGLKNKDKYDYFMKKKIYCGAIDIARVEILYQLGGIYIDADSVCLESIENEWFMKKEFFAVKEYEKRIANGVIGTKKEHPIMKEYINRILKAKIIEPPYCTIGGTMFTDCINDYGKNDNIVILPTYSFYPKNHRGCRVKVIGKMYAKQLWATTNNLYK